MLDRKSAALENIVGQERFKVATDPGGNRALSINGPGEHRPAVEVLDEPGQSGGVAGAEFAGSDRFVQEFLRFLAQGAELRKCDGVEVRVGEIDLEISEAVGHGLGSRREGGALDVEFDERFKCRFILGARGRELLRYGGGRTAAEGEEQA